MTNGHVKYLIVGGGVAGFSAAAAIRQRDSHGLLMLVGQEINRPYYRTDLSKGFLRRQIDRSKLFTAEPDWFTAHGVQLHTGRRVASLDTGRAIVTLDNGQAVSYDRLLLATGSSPRALTIPGGVLPNIFNPRTIENYAQLHTAIDKAKAEGHRRKSDNTRGLVAVIGGGLLGVEIAASLAQSGLAVDLIVSGRHPWSRFASEATGQVIAHFLGRHGLTLHESVRAARIEGDGRAQRVVLSDGRALECDFVVSAIGAIPNKEILRGTGIVAERAILADEFCQTNEPHVYAAGDCAAVRDPIFGKHRAADQWDTAEVTGTLAGANMAGEQIKYSDVTSFTTEAFGLAARCWGHYKHVDRRLLRGTPNVEAPDFLEFGVTVDGRISQILAVGHAGEDDLIKELVRNRAGVAGKEEAIKDASIPLRDL